MNCRFGACLLFGLLVTGCSKVDETAAQSSTAAPQLFAKSEAGFADAELVARSVAPGTDGTTIIIAEARSGDQELGLRIVLPATWKSSAPKGFPGTIFQGVIKIESLGVKTEAFVRALAKAYGESAGSFAFTEVSLTALSLEGDPNKVQTLPVQLKLFYESRKENEAAEFFLNLDLPKGIVQIHEKDPDYRKAIIGFFTQKKP